MLDATVSDRWDADTEPGDFDSRWERVLNGELMPGLSKHFRRLPSAPRCKGCQVPFAGPLTPLLRLLGFRPWKLNQRLCHHCFHGIDEMRGGAEVPVSLLFADVRDSTVLAEATTAREYRRLMDRFYKLVFRAVDQNGGIIDHLAGDGVMAFWTRRFGGKDHAKRALAAGRQLTSDLVTDSVMGGRVFAGVGVHTGSAWVGVVGASGGHDFTVLGDAPNTVARLGSAAGGGELLLSSALVAEAEIATDHLEQKDLSLKGKAETFTAWLESVA